MATWKLQNVVLTDKGLEILSRVALGDEKITIASAVTSSKRVPFDELHSLEVLSDIGISLDIIDYQYLKDGGIIAMQLSNDFVTKETPVVLIGIYATHPSVNGAFLYAVAECEEGTEDVVPPYSDTPATIGYNFYLLHSTEAVINFTPDSGGYVTRTEFNKHIYDFNNPHKVYFTQLIDFEYWRDLILSKASQEDLDDLREDLQSLSDKITTDITSNPFIITFESLNGLEVTGVWNKSSARIEC